MAMFFGHDHTNSFELIQEGTDIINSPGVGFNSYNGVDVGVRVIELDEKNPDTYETYLCRYLDAFAGNTAAMGLFKMHSSTSRYPDQITGFFEFIFGSVIDLFRAK